MADKRKLAIGATAAAVIIGGTALVLGQSDDSKNTKIDEAIAVLEEAKAIPAETVTQTITETLTITLTATESPTTTTTKPPSCTGTQVPPGGGLKPAMDAAPAGTFCLAAGTYTVPATITFANGDKLVGVGSETLVKGTGALNIFSGASGAVWEVRSIDISGGVANSTCGVNCGRAFQANGSKLTIVDTRCHDNVNQCIGGGGADIVFTDSECDHNGTPPFYASGATESAACIKRASTGGGNLLVEGSNIHDNAWVGVWCDFCQDGPFVVRDSTFTDNGKTGVSYEVSGGYNATDNAVVENNVIQDNGTGVGGVNAGIVCNSCADLVIRNNTFGGNGEDGAVYFLNNRRGPWGDIAGVVVQNNTLNGDRLSCLSGVTCSANQP